MFSWEAEVKYWLGQQNSWKVDGPWPLLIQEVVSTGQMTSMICGQGEVELYVKTLARSRKSVRVSPNCNQDSWALGCQPGWACSTPDDKAPDESIPPRALNCRPCCPGFFCPRGLTCMMRKFLSQSNFPSIQRLFCMKPRARCSHRPFESEQC